MRPTIITLSAIPPRFPDLEPCLTSLLRQSLPADEVRLYIPETYRRFPEWDGVLPEVPPGVIIYRTVEDLGPATKVLPAAHDLRGQEVDLLFCDDDKIYDTDWHRRFKTEAEQRPGCCIVESGFDFHDIADCQRPVHRLPRFRMRRKDWKYRLVRSLTLALYKPRREISGGYVDQLEGFAGVLVQPSWFDSHAYEIPDNMWMVDDPWLSGHLERNGIPIWRMISPKRLQHVRTTKLHALHNLVVDGSDRVSSDLAVKKYMRETYGIW